MSSDATVGFGLHDVARMMRRDFDSRAREQGLTRARWQVLWYLARSEGIYQAALAELLGVAPISLTRQLDRLEEEGLVERRADPQDRRRYRLYLTTQAQPALDNLRQLAAQTRERALAGLGEGDIEALQRMLNVMRANLCDKAG
ncbi:MarR family winged helix-turn-helix transcriptional regulator [Alloalcanivorax mobilis]|uniref:MarR family winged helix-turn-helix transcriptional regulator n=1 Tax=Alloalcanivorax mobilis TaxID=2019569 RepID=UPI000B5B26F2|nr:MarR family transcriptional regulator [Alloalcanivorax mobilis]ASK35201.1 MarR family transcriptional regulator [Alcanivorax sp. N3-2A]|tara:strand:- start:42010 stop:42441 length:432 start_codon:yes stop_codon:yes gene_type:complete